MKKSIFIAAFYIFQFSQTGCQFIDNWQARRDFKEICNVFIEIKGKNIVDPAERAFKTAETIEKRIHSRAAVNTIKVISNADVLSKYQLIKQGAKEVGLEDYSCPEMEAVFKGE